MFYVILHNAAYKEQNKKIYTLKGSVSAGFPSVSYINGGNCSSSVTVKISIDKNGNLVIENFIMNISGVAYKYDGDSTSGSNQTSTYNLTSTE